MAEGIHKYSISMPSEVAEEARRRGGPSGLSSYVAAAVARQLERDNLRELIDAIEAEHGPPDPDAVEAKRRLLAQGEVSAPPGSAA
jgi:hypothetical protein